MSAFSRPVLLLLTALLFFTVSMAVLNTLVPLWLDREQPSTLYVGMVSSGYFLGNLVGTLAAGLLIRNIGFNRSYYLAGIVFALATLGLGFGQGVNDWVFWRLLAGVACAIIWVVIESSLLRSGTLKNRGALLAAYMAIYYLGTLIGQAILNFVPTLRYSVLPWAIILTLVSLMPLIFARLSNPLYPDHPSSLWLMFSLKSARTGILGCVISGIILGILYGLMPLYLTHRGLSDGSVAGRMALPIAASILAQFPIGKLADKYGRLNVLKLQSIMVIFACFVVLMSEATVEIALILLGGFGFTLYPLSMAWASEGVSSDELVTMNQTLLLSYTLGSLIGPALTSILMQHCADSALFAVIALCAALFFAKLSYMKNERRPSFI